MKIQAQRNESRDSWSARSKAFDDYLSPGVYLCRAIQNTRDRTTTKRLAAGQKTSWPEKNSKTRYPVYDCGWRENTSETRRIYSYFSDARYESGSDIYTHSKPCARSGKRVFFVFYGVRTSPKANRDKLYSVWVSDWATSGLRAELLRQLRERQECNNSDAYITRLDNAKNRSQRTFNNRRQKRETPITKFLLLDFT